MVVFVDWGGASQQKLGIKNAIKSKYTVISKGPCNIKNILLTPTEWTYGYHDCILFSNQVYLSVCLRY